MTPRLWILVLLGWLLLGPVMPAHATMVCPPCVQSGPMGSPLTGDEAQGADHVAPVHLALCQAIGRHSTQWVRLTSGAWPLLPGAAPFGILPGIQAFGMTAPQAARLTDRYRSASPRAPPVSL
jgi:hypothetical protein